SREQKDASQLDEAHDPTDLLVRRACNGDQHAFEALYQAHYRRVYALCLRLSGDAAAAEELTQEAFVRAWQKLATFRGEAQFSTWLHRLTVNEVLQWQRRNRPWLRRVLPGMEDEMELRAAEERTGEARDLEQAIAALPERA